MNEQEILKSICDSLRLSKFSRKVFFKKTFEILRTLERLGKKKKKAFEWGKKIDRKCSITEKKLLLSNKLKFTEIYPEIMELKKILGSSG